MSKTKVPIAAALALCTAGCVGTGYYPTYPATYGYGSPGYYDSGYSGRYYSSSYYSQPAYYYRPAPVTNYYTPYSPRPAVVTRTRYVPVPAATPHHHHHKRDRDHDGVPDRWQRH